jgi:hypothetical protein
MKIFLVPAGQQHYNYPENFAIFNFDLSGIWLRYTSIPSQQILLTIPSLLQFLNEQLKLNGNIISQNKPFNRFMLIAKEETLFQLQLSVIDYLEFDAQ